MNKLISIVVMAALMLWSPILAEAKDKPQPAKILAEAKDKPQPAKEKHHKHGKPFVSLQEQINDLEDTVYGIDPGSGLQEQIDAIHLTIDAIEQQLESSGSSGSYYTVAGNAFEVPTDSEIFEVELVCNPGVSGQKVMSGGYDLRLLENEFGLPEQFPFYSVHVIGQGPNSAGDGWKVRVVNFGGVPGKVEVTAVCFGQPPAD